MADDATRINDSHIIRGFVAYSAVNSHNIWYSLQQDEDRCGLRVACCVLRVTRLLKEHEKTQIGTMNRAKLRSQLN